MSLRGRLTAFFAISFGALLAAFLAFIYTVLGASLQSDLRVRAEHDLAQILVVFGEHDSFEGALEELRVEEADEFAIQIRLLDESGKEIFHSYGFDRGPFTLAAAPPARARTWNAGRLSGEPHLVLREPFVNRGRSLYCEIWKSKTPVEAIQRKFLVIALVGAPFILFLSVIVGQAFARRTLRPVEDLRERADVMSPTALSARLPLPRHKDELFRLATTLNNLLARIESSVETMKRFTADASHELRIPLTNLRGTIEVNLRRKRDVAEHEADWADALEEVDRLTQLVVSLLSLARMDAGKWPIEPREIALRPFLEELLESARQVAAGKDIALALDGAPDATARFDPDKVQRLLMALLENAVTYTPAGGSVWLGARLDRNALDFLVRDSGPGIPEAERERVFERFYRLEKSRSRAGGGTGLGLAIARSIAEAHGGTLTLDPGGPGSTFRFHLPAALD